MSPSALGENPPVMISPAPPLRALDIEAGDALDRPIQQLEPRVHGAHDDAVGECSGNRGRGASAARGNRSSRVMLCWRPCARMLVSGSRSDGVALPASIVRRVSRVRSHQRHAYLRVMRFQRRTRPASRATLATTASLPGRRRLAPWPETARTRGTYARRQPCAPTARGGARELLGEARDRIGQCRRTGGPGRPVGCGRRRWHCRTTADVRHYRAAIRRRTDFRIACEDPSSVARLAMRMADRDPQSDTVRVERLRQADPSLCALCARIRHGHSGEPRGRVLERDPGIDGRGIADGSDERRR